MLNQNKPTLDEILDMIFDEAYLTGTILLDDENPNPAQKEFSVRDAKQLILRYFEDRYIKRADKIVGKGGWEKVFTAGFESALETMECYLKEDGLEDKA